MARKLTEKWGYESFNKAFSEGVIKPGNSVSVGSECVLHYNVISGGKLCSPMGAKSAEQAIGEERWYAYVL